MDVREVRVEGWERVLVAREGEYHCVVAIHSTALGTALGGTRLWRYASESAALADALRLSRGMTYKNAMAGLAAGGGKSVLLMPERLADREALFLAHGCCVEADRRRQPRRHGADGRLPLAPPPRARPPDRPGAEPLSRRTPPLSRQRFRSGFECLDACGCRAYDRTYITTVE